MRIAIDCRSVFPGMGGIGRATLNLVRALVQIAPENHYVLLFTERKGADQCIAGPHVETHAYPCAMLDPVWEQLQLPEILKSLEVDLFHGTCFSVPVPRIGVPYVATIHDVVFLRRPELVDPALAHTLSLATRIVCTVADAIVTVSEFSRQDIAEACGVPAGRIHVVPNGVEVRFQPPGDIQELAAWRKAKGLDAPYLLYVGALEAKKNLPRLLAAFRQLLNCRHDLRHQLVLAGGAGGRPFDLAAAIAEHGLESRVRALGYVADDELPRLYQAADAFVYPSLYEGFGLPPLEAMACGIPTLVSDATSLPEVIGNGALVVPASDTDAMATGLDRLLLALELRQRLHTAGPTQAKRFSWETSARALLEVYGLALSTANAPKAKSKRRTRTTVLS